MPRHLNGPGEIAGANAGSYLLQTLQAAAFFLDKLEVGFKRARRKSSLDRNYFWSSSAETPHQSGGEFQKCCGARLFQRCVLLSLFVFLVFFARAAARPTSAGSTTSSSTHSSRNERITAWRFQPRDSALARAFWPSSSSTRTKMESVFFFGAPELFDGIGSVYHKETANAILDIPDFYDILIRSSDDENTRCLRSRFVYSGRSSLCFEYTEGTCI